MTLVTSSGLADRLGVSRGRISQYVAEGKLAGCYTGDGRARRFDLGKCAAALDRKLDLGQRMGNGAETAGAIRNLPLDQPAPRSTEANPFPTRADPEADRYQKARADIAEVKAVKERLALAESEGRYVLASEVELNMRRVLAAEIAEIESVLRTAAQKVAAEMFIDARSVRAILLGAWREHRANRADAAAERAVTAQFSEAEQAEAVTH